MHSPQCARSSQFREKGLWRMTALRLHVELTANLNRWFQILILCFWKMIPYTLMDVYGISSALPPLAYCADIMSAVDRW